MTRSFLLAVLLFSVSAAAAPGKLRFVTTTTDLAWVAERLGGDRVEVTPLLSGRENPHFLDPVPEHVRLVSTADALCYVGLQLEIGWLPKLLHRAGNAAVKPGGKGHCETGKAVTIIDATPPGEHPSLDTIHPSGNPHFWMNPERLGEAAGVVAETLVRLDPANRERYEAALAALRKDLAALLDRNRTRLKPILDAHPGPLAIEYHKEFSYFDQAYGINCLGTIEQKPGLPPSAGRLALVAKQARDAGVKVAFAADYAPKHLLKRFKELSGVPTLVLPLSTPREGNKVDYPAFQDKLIDKLVLFFGNKPGGK